MSQVQRFTTHPKIVEAMCFTTNNEQGSPTMDAIVNWLNQGKDTMVAWHNGTDIFVRAFRTSEIAGSFNGNEELRARVGDWIVRYPDHAPSVYHPDSFNATYKKQEGAGLSGKPKYAAAAAMADGYDPMLADVQSDITDMLTEIARLRAEEDHCRAVHLDSVADSRDGVGTTPQRVDVAMNAWLSRPDQARDSYPSQMCLPNTTYAQDMRVMHVFSYGKAMVEIDWLRQIRALVVDWIRADENCRDDVDEAVVVAYNALRAALDIPWSTTMEPRA